MLGKPLKRYQFGVELPGGHRQPPVAAITDDIG